MAQESFHFVSPNSVISYLTHVGASGVHIFFVISGFIMVFTTHGESGPVKAKEFLARRLTRIYPIYWIYAFAYLAIHHLVFSGYELAYSDIVRALLLTPNHGGLIIGPGWTLPFELYFYLCFAVALLFPPRVMLATLTVFFIVSISLGALKPSWITFLPFNPLLLEFIAGSWVGHFIASGRKLSAALSYALVGSSFAFFAIITFIGYDGLPSVITWGVPSVLLVAGLSSLELVGALPAWIKKVSILGDSSYSLYLLHTLLLHVIFTLIPIGHHFTLQVITILFATALCVIASVIAYEWVELPVLKLTRRMLVRRHPVGNQT